MKKLLLSLVALFATIAASAGVVSFQQSNFNGQGVSGGKDDGTSSISATVDGITLSEFNGYCKAGGTFFQFYAKGGKITIKANEKTITKVVITATEEKYNGLQSSGTITPSTGAVSVDGSVITWTGSVANELTIEHDKQIRSTQVDVTYETAGGDTPVSGTFDDLYVPFKFDGVNYTDVKDEWANPVIDQENGKSEISFSTSNIDFKALGGTTPKDVELAVGEPFTGWTAGWNDVKWDRKNQNLDDMKTRFFAYVVGTGNPVVGLTAEEITTEGAQTGKWRALYTYYGPKDGEINGKNYKRELPKQGLYYEFAAKKDGTLKIAVWSNKGKRNTFVIDKATMDPVAFECEGYYNGQNEADPNNEGKNQKKWLTNDDIVTLHNNAFTRQAKKDEAGNAVVDEAGNPVYETIEDTYPYVIADGNQNFWGYLVMPLKAGQTYLLFQDSSQIGFAGFQFTDGKVAEGDLFSATATVFLPEGISKVEGVTYNGDETFTATAGTEVTVTFTDPCTEYTLTGITGTITPSSGAWVVKSAENGTVVVAYEGTSEDAKYAVSFTSDANETFRIANTGEIAAIASVNADKATAPRKVLVNGQIMIGNYNIAGQRVK